MVRVIKRSYFDLPYGLVVALINFSEKVNVDQNLKPEFIKDFVHAPDENVDQLFWLVV